MPTPKGYKLTVTQTYEVTIYYQEGIHTDATTREQLAEETRAIVEDDAVELAFSEEGLVVVLHEESESGNGFVAFVETFDPDVKLEYSIDSMPKVIKEAIERKFTPEQRKEFNIAEE